MLIMPAPGLYSKEIMKHFRNPKNIGSMKFPDAVGEAGNIVCGDIMKIYLKVKNGRISDIKAECYGCVVAIANTSVLTTMVKGKKLSDALKLTKDDIVKKLGKVPPVKYHCSLLAIDALYEAIYNYYEKNGIEIPSDLQAKHKKVQQSSEIIEGKALHHHEGE